MTSQLWPHASRPNTMHGDGSMLRVSLANCPLLNFTLAFLWIDVDKRDG